MKTIVKVANGLWTIGVIFLCCACDHEDMAVNKAADYFPLEENVAASYLKEHFGHDQTIWWTDTVRLTISGDTIVQGLSYKKILTEYGTLEKIVRKEGTQYFGRNHELYGGFSWEYLFLDTNLPVGSTWVHVKNEGQFKTEYVVEELNSTLVIHGIEFKDVIKLKANYYDTYSDGITFEYRYSVEHYYANGVGEIYAYYPYQALGTFSNLKISILPNFK